MDEPLQYYFRKFGFNGSAIQRIASGEKYFGLMLKNGNIGVCATLKNKIVAPGLYSDIKPDLEKTTDRILFTAYLNALLNYETNYKEDKDIFDFINFERYNNLVMVGDFKPLIKKFLNFGMKPAVFDLFSEDEIVLPLQLRTKYIQKADGLILTATSIFNSTFSEILNKVKKNCDVYILGPTSILNNEMKTKWNIKTIFGTVFEKNDDRILDIISMGEGTRHFQPLGKKVYL